MAGEIHNFDGNRRRKRPKWQDDKSADKYYESEQVSAIAGKQSAADSPLKPGETPHAPRPKLPKQDDRRADKYYENPAHAAPTKQQLANGLTGKRPPSASRPATPAQRTPEVISDPSQVQDAIDSAVERLKAGETGVVLYVTSGDSALLRRVRASLDLLVTREAITEEEYREVRISYTAGEPEKKEIEDKLGVPEPRGEAEADPDVDEAELDFLSGASTADLADVFDTSPAEATEVDCSADVQDSPAPSYPSAPGAAEDEDDSDFVGPAAAPAEEAAQGETPAAPTQAQPKQKSGKKHGKR